MIETLLTILLPKEKLAVEDAYMSTVLDYQRRLARLHLDVDSEAGEARPMLFVCDRPGRYVGNGKEVRWTVR